MTNDMLFCIVSRQRGHSLDLWLARTATRSRTRLVSTSPLSAASASILARERQVRRKVQVHRNLTLTRRSPFPCGPRRANPKCPVAGHRSHVHAIVWNDDGTKLASGSDDSTAKIWDPASGECLWTLRGHSNAVSSLAFKPHNPNILVTGSWDRTVKLWDLATSTCFSTMRGHGSKVMSVSWSPDGTRLASGGSDKTVRLWDASTGAPIGSPLKGHCKDNEECTCKHDAGMFGNGI